MNANKAMVEMKAWKSQQDGDYLFIIIRFGKRNKK